MPKIENNTETTPSLSPEMVKNCKSEISKFGFEISEYENFLESVAAMKGTSVLKYRNDEIDEYRKKFVKAKENSINDVMMFDKIAKIKSKNESGHQNETGYFCPKIFWDLIIKS